MTTREGDDLDLVTSDISLAASRVPAHDRPVIIHDDPPAEPAEPAEPGGRRLLLVIGGALVLVAVVVAAAVAGRQAARDTPQLVVASAGGPGAATGVVPLALTLRVDGPATVAAGQPAHFVVHYADGEGFFSGGSEDWGGVGASSIKESACGSAPPAGKLSDSYEVTHSWAKPGHYPVRIGVTTYTCAGGVARPETATRGLQVTVTAR